MSQGSPTVSVVLCTFNGAAFVAAQLASILAQTIPPTQIVVADDGSTDDTPQIVDAALAESTVSVVRLAPQAKPLGPAQNFSRALAAATGDVVVLADQDDLWSPRRIAAALEMLAEDPGVMVVAHDAELIDESGEPENLTSFSSMRVTAEEIRLLNSADATVALTRRNVIAGMSLAVRRELLDIALPIPVAWMHDYWIVSLAGATGSLRVVPDPTLLSYRQHRGNAIGIGSRALWRRVRKLWSTPSDAATNRAMFGALLARLDSLGTATQVRARLDGKLAFEVARTNLSDRFVPRAAAALRLAGTGAYRDFASNGTLNVLRDIRHAPRTGSGQG